MESQYILNAVPACPPGEGAAIQAGAWRQGWLARWQAFLTSRARRRTATLLSELDEHILRDIGAPEWALRDSELLRQTEHDRRAHWLSP